jgi:uncharacterized protein (DUF1330 family)
LILITQLIYLKAGQAELFEQFEAMALPLIGKYNGRLLLRVRPPAEAFIEAHTDLPDEIHIVEFDSEDDFSQFLKDETRQQFIHLKEAAIRSAVMIKGARF